MSKKEIDIDWFVKDKVENLAKELLKALSYNLMDDRWHIYSVRFKKNKNGEITIADPTSKDIQNLKD